MSYRNGNIVCVLGSGFHAKLFIYIYFHILNRMEGFSIWSMHDGDWNGRYSVISVNVNFWSVQFGSLKIHTAAPSCQHKNMVESNSFFFANVDVRRFCHLYSKLKFIVHFKWHLGFLKLAKARRKSHQHGEHTKCTWHVRIYVCQPQ